MARYTRVWRADTRRRLRESGESGGGGRRGAAPTCVFLVHAAFLADRGRNLMSQICRGNRSPADHLLFSQKLRPARTDHQRRATRRSAHARRVRRNRAALPSCSSRVVAKRSSARDPRRANRRVHSKAPVASANLNGAEPRPGRPDEPGDHGGRGHGDGHPRSEAVHP
jgi:hypothetical protein